MADDLTIHALVVDAEARARRKGFYDPGMPDSIAHDCALLHSEVSEITEEDRKGYAPTAIRFADDGKPLGIPIELADVVIRAAQVAGHRGVDLVAAIRLKSAWNETRERHHGKRY